MYCLLLIYTRRDWLWWMEDRETARMRKYGELKRLELWWQLYRTSLPVWDLENLMPMDFCLHECTQSILQPICVCPYDKNTTHPLHVSAFYVVITGGNCYKTKKYTP